MKPSYRILETTYKGTNNIIRWYREQLIVQHRLRIRQEHLQMKNKNENVPPHRIVIVQDVQVQMGLLVHTKMN